MFIYTYIYIYTHTHTQTHILYMGFQGNSASKEPVYNAGNPSSIPGSGRSPGERIGYPILYSWSPLVVPMVTNLLAKLIPGLGRSPGGRHANPSQYSCLKNPHGQRNLTSYSPQGRKELDTTEQPSTAYIYIYIYIYVYIYKMKGEAYD